MKELIPFPDLETESTLETPCVAVLSSLLGAVILPFSTVLGMIFLTPCILILLNSIRIEVTNAIVRHLWAHKFNQRISSRKLKSLVQSEPERYVLHYRGYGGFDSTHPMLAAAVEDRLAEDFVAIYPPSWKAITICEQAGVQIIR